MTSFTDLGVPARLSEVLTDLDIHTPTPIQHATLSDGFAGRDVLGRGRTGSGKTLAFLLPVVARLSGGRAARSGAPRALILAPTRELAGQVDAALRPLAKAAGLSSHTVFGGVAQNRQVSALRRGVDIVVACPGRLEDLIGQGHCSLGEVEITVLDEADHMADLGFLPAVRRLLTRTPPGGQRLLFSATLDRSVDALVRQFLTDPAVHEADSAKAPVATMAHHILHVDQPDRLPVLAELAGTPDRTLVFTRTKHGAKALARRLNRSGVAAVELHGNLAQNARTRNLEAFHTGRASTLVATDIAARGIHVDDVHLVVHADPPADHKAYLHRSGRTARAGNAGTVVTLMTTAQIREVKALTRSAGITATTTRVGSAGHPMLATLAGGPSGSAHTPHLTPPRPVEVDDAKPEKDTPHPAPTGRRRRRRRGSNGGRGDTTATKQRPAAATTRGGSPGRATNRRAADAQPGPPTRHSAASFSAKRR